MDECVCFVQASSQSVNPLVPLTNIEAQETLGIHFARLKDTIAPDMLKTHQNVLDFLTKDKPLAHYAKDGTSMMTLFLSQSSDQDKKLKCIMHAVYEWVCFARYRAQHFGFVDDFTDAKHQNETKRCLVCGARAQLDDVSIQNCGACGIVHYCGRVCQKKDWPLHKTACQPLSALRKILDVPKKNPHRC